VKLEWVYNTEKFLSENSWLTDMIPGIVWNFYVSFIKNLAPYIQETSIRYSDITDPTPPTKIKWQEDCN
jgi:hypothetical protein